MPIYLDHIVLNVEDVDNMLLFYTNILGLQPERVKEFQAGQALFPSIRINANTIIDFFPKSLWSGQDEKAAISGLNHFCLSFDKKEWDEAYQRINSHNICIEEGPVKRWGALGLGISIYILDPEHNKIEVRYYPTNIIGI